LSFPGAYHEKVTTASDGTFAFRLVPSKEASHQLSVIIPGYSGNTTVAYAVPGRVTEYNLTVREDVTSMEKVQGRVVDTEDQTISGALVRIEGFSPIVTDSQGSFTLVAPDREGTRTVTVSSPGFFTTLTSIDILPGETVTFDLLLGVPDSQATSVSGMVVRADDSKGIEGVTVRLGWSGSTTWTYKTITSEDGSFEFRMVPREWGSVRITVTSGEFKPDMAITTLSVSGPTFVTFALARIQVETPEEPILTKEEAKAVGLGVGATMAAFAAIAATEVGRVALMGLILVPLYTKIKREKVMDHFVRGRIYEYIVSNPGVNYSAIKEQFTLTNGTVTYHLSMLERQEFIRARQDGIYKRYFANGKGASHIDVEPMSVQLSIAKAIRAKPGMTQKQIAKQLGSSKQLISYHIRRMKKDGLLDTRRDGRSMKVFPNPHTPE
jgi:DNA-binding MarR family transcriptional regulator